MTGSAKTKILHELRKLGEQVIDLEDLAQHNGSSYGTMNKMIQPTQEQFENNLAEQLRDLDRGVPVWVEDESLNIGKVSVPRPFWIQMTNAVEINLKVGLEQRIEELVKVYGSLDKDFLVTCTERIHKRLGPVQTKQAIAAIRENRMSDFIRLVLVYYDKTYLRSLNKKDGAKLFDVSLQSDQHAENALTLLDFRKTIPNTLS
jgi:tRNA 2-selenouridine synthase